MYSFLDNSTSVDNSPSLGRTDTSSNNKFQIGNQVAIELLSLRNQIKIFHWQTKGYAEHKALDKLFNILNDQNDRWVETFMGKYGRIKITNDNNKIQLYNKNKQDTMITFLKHWIEHMLDIRNTYFNQPDDSDLSNIFDEIFGDINRTCYLLSLK